MYDETSDVTEATSGIDWSKLAKIMAVSSVVTALRSSQHINPVMSQWVDTEGGSVLSDGNILLL